MRLFFGDHASSSCDYFVNGLRMVSPKCGWSRDGNTEMGLLILMVLIWDEQRRSRDSRSIIIIMHLCWSKKLRQCDSNSLAVGTERRIFHEERGSGLVAIHTSVTAMVHEVLTALHNITIVKRLDQFLAFHCGSLNCQRKE